MLLDTMLFGISGSIFKKKQKGFFFFSKMGKRQTCTYFQSCRNLFLQLVLKSASRDLLSYISARGVYCQKSAKVRKTSLSQVMRCILGCCKLLSFIICRGCFARGVMLSFLCKVAGQIQIRSFQSFYQPRNILLPPPFLHLHYIIYLDYLV